MAISKSLSLPRPLNLPKPAPSAQASAPKPPAQAQGGIAGQAASPHKGIAKPLGERNRTAIDEFNPNAKPVNLPGAGGGGINLNAKAKPHGAPTVGINPNTPNGGIIETGGWANHQPGRDVQTGPAIGGRNPHATGDINTHGTKPPQPEPWTTYGEALEQNRDVFPNKDTYDLGAAFDRAFDQGVGIGVSGGAETKPGGGWGDLIEKNKDSIPPGWADNE